MEKHSRLFGVGVRHHSSSRFIVEEIRSSMMMLRILFWHVSILRGKESLRKSSRKLASMQRIIPATQFSLLVLLAVSLGLAGTCREPHFCK